VITAHLKPSPASLKSFSVNFDRLGGIVVLVNQFTVLFGGCFGAFGSVLGTSLLAVFDPSGIEGAANDVISDPGQVFNPTAPDQDDGVFL
jgi:hypothetical protein